MGHHVWTQHHAVFNTLMVTSTLNRKYVECIEQFFGNISQHSSNLPRSAIISIELRRLTQQLLEPYPNQPRTLPCHILYNRQVRDRMELTFTVFFLLYRCLTFNRCRSLCLYCNMMGDSFSITLSSLIGPRPCRWVRDEKEEEWEDPKSFFRV